MLTDCGLGKSLIGNLKGQEYLPSDDKIALIAQRHSVTTDYLLGIDETFLSTNDKASYSISQDAIEVALAYETADLGHKSAIQVILGLSEIKKGAVDAKKVG